MQQVQQGISARTITSSRLRTRVLFSGPDHGEPVLFLHGNLSSATWWEETMLALPTAYRGIAPDQRGYGESDPAAVIDATRGMGDLADDVIALLDALQLRSAHLVASSLGGVIAYRSIADHADRFRSVTLVAPGSPYGFAGTKDVSGTLCYDDGAGSGAGLIHPELVRLLREGYRGGESLFSMRSALRRGVWNPPFIPAREEELLTAALQTQVGDRAYPGDAKPSRNWPFRAPGIWGPNNALSPIYVSRDVPRLIAAQNKPAILWIRGDADVVVSDQAAADPGTLGRLKVLPGWPGEQVYPAQPMIGQIRTVLTRYGNAGGAYRELVMPGVGHAPFIEKPREFNDVLHFHLSTVARSAP